MPLVFAVLGLALLAYGCFGHINPLAVVLAGASLVAVMTRLVLTFQDNNGMLRQSQDGALTDALTGMPNRRAWQRDIHRRMDGERHDETLVLVLFDLDGFKLYNDTFGHPAGDALLVRLGESLTRHPGDRGTAYRMGGDEFCALIEPGEDALEPLVQAAADALSERGEGFSITCSFGSVITPLEAAGPQEAIQIADQRMYLRKGAARVSAGRQSTDVLLRALAERNPGLGVHVSDVADLSARVARRLELPAERVEQIRLAAELHDVGKVAVPDDVLRKAGPLNHDEWAFVPEHTLIGERIIAAAPALKEVSLIVRSSHERWDGRGYPDQLVGDAIPLGSRVVAVADAFDAMTEARPYDGLRSPAMALGELRRCSGTQFDPRVVQAFCEEWAQRHGGAGDDTDSAGDAAAVEHTAPSPEAALDSLRYRSLSDQSPRGEVPRPANSRTGD